MQSIIRQEFIEHLKTAEATNERIGRNIETTAKLCINSLQKGGKILIFGNGGSAAIASHVSVDFTKNANIRAVNFNESGLFSIIPICIALGNNSISPLSSSP